MLKCFLIDLVNRISSQRKFKKFFGTSKFEGPLRKVKKTPWGFSESIFQGRPLNVRLGRPWDVISGRQIETSDWILGTSWVPTFAVGNVNDKLAIFDIGLF